MSQQNCFVAIIIIEAKSEKRKIKKLGFLVERELQITFLL